MARIREAREKQVYPFYREFEAGGIRASIDGRPLINFSSNDYLGLTNHPRVKEAARKAVDTYACGLSSSRIQATTVEHALLEKRLAKWFGFESCLVSTTGYQAMVGAIVALADKDTTLILDSFSHACILDGSFLAAGVPGRGCEIRFFNHNSARSLERILKTRERKNALVIVEGIYSLDGDRAHLKEFIEICDRYDAPLIVDDAHGTGTLGTRGTGILEEMGLEGKVPIVVSTFSKTFGGIGGVLLASGEVVEHVKHTARAFLFSAALPVPIVAAASTILDMLEEDGPALVTELHQKADYMRSKLLGAGFDLGASNTHIMPVMCRDERKTLFMHIALFECGVMMVPITYPGVKLGEERLRVNITRGHTQEDMDTALELLKTYGEAFFVLSGEDLGPMEQD
ncbi:aminotransferase class I/II-fold pyridoxal phosphate-dependent enzyme [Pendulispora albinea]|uniref:Pyridoxal phosphate-dependent aminotransferase family protein n=1 Tax=Pendulispora albinea TaxID=2741071 RepID=A0ABZ2LKR1_9BACT